MLVDLFTYLVHLQDTTFTRLGPGVRGGWNKQGGRKQAGKGTGRCGEKQGNYLYTATSGLLQVVGSQ